MEWLTLVLGFLGIAAAIAIPLVIEYERRPRLRIERGDDADNTTAPGMASWRIVHIRVVNEPITRRWGTWLLRNVATGCHVKITLRSRSDQSEVPFRGKWSARPEPIQYVFNPPGPPPTFTPMWDPEKEPAGFTYDLPPGFDGEAVAVAIKHDGDAAAYAFGVGIYHHLPGPLKTPRLALPDTEYDVIVRATAGEIVEEEHFVLRNEGSRYTGLSLRPDRHAR